MVIFYLIFFCVLFYYLIKKICISFKLMKKPSRYALISGSLIGFSTAYLAITSICDVFYVHKCTLLDIYPYNNTKIGEKKFNLDQDNFRYREDTAVANVFIKEFKILFFVMTSGKYHDSRAQYIMQTWGYRADGILFISNVHDARLPVVHLIVSNDDPFQKTIETLQYLYKHKYNDYDWFAKADDTTYYIVENLRHLLSKYNPDEAVVFGLKYFHEKMENGYITNEAGFVLSRQALQRVVIHGIQNMNDLFNRYTYDADLKLSHLMRKLSIVMIDTRDPDSKERFHPFDPSFHLTETVEVNERDSEDVKNWKSRFYSTNDGKLRSCSDTSISFNNMLPADMFAIDYFLYCLRPFGIIYY